MEHPKVAVFHRPVFRIQERRHFGRLQFSRCFREIRHRSFIIVQTNPIRIYKRGVKIGIHGNTAIKQITRHATNDITLQGIRSAVAILDIVSSVPLNSENASDIAAGIRQCFQNLHGAPVIYIRNHTTVIIADNTARHQIINHRHRIGHRARHVAVIERFTQRTLFTLAIS